MASKATTKATAQPTSNIVMLWALTHVASPLIISSTSSRVAPAMVGTARKKENSAARLRVSPCCMPPTIVAMERETPGMTEMHWKRPTIKALRSVMRFSSVPLLNILSQKSMNTPPTTSMMATTSTLSSNQPSKPDFLANRPMTTAGNTPTTSSQ